MPQADGLYLELGCGKGRFTAETAAQHPDVLFVAVERVPDAMVIAMERCQALGLTNVFFIDGDAARLDDYFSGDEVDRLYINFCDPWPSMKQAKRRLTHEGFLRSYRRVLKEGGEIHFKTDNRDLYEWSLFQFPKAGYRLSQVSRDLHRDGITGVMTDYEEKFYRLGTPINRCVGTKVPLEEEPVRDGLSKRLEGQEIRFEMPEEETGFPAEQESRMGIRAALAEPQAKRPGLREKRRETVALLRGGKPAVLLVYAEGYPRAQTLWLEDLLTTPDARRDGLEDEALEALAGAGLGAGFLNLRLCCGAEEETLDFWRERGFYGVRPAGSTPNRPMMVMERILRE